MVEYVWSVLWEMLTAAVKDTVESGQAQTISTYSCDSDSFSSDSEVGVGYILLRKLDPSFLLLPISAN